MTFGVILNYVELTQSFETFLVFSLFGVVKAWISDDLQFLFFQKPNILEVHSFDGTQYNYIQTLSSLYEVGAIVTSSDSQILAIAWMDPIVKIYQRNGTSFN